MHLLVGCGANEGALEGNTDSGNGTYEEIENENLQTDSVGVIEEVELEPIPFIFRNRMTGYGQLNNQIFLMDLTTSELIETYEVDGADIVNEVWVLENGYYVAWIGNGWAWNFEFESQTERNFRLAIFDENLNYIESLPYDEEEFLFLWNSLLRFEDGVLYVYGWVWSIEAITDLQRINVHTGEITTLIEGVPFMNLEGFVSSNQILVTKFEAPELGATDMTFYTHYGILDLETKEVDLLTEVNYSHALAIIKGSQAILTERDPRGMFTIAEPTNQVIIFDLENRSSQMIQLAYGDSESARLSYDGNHLVTINVAASVFRKYDMNGEIIAEVSIDLSEKNSPLDIPEEVLPFESFEIIPVTDQIYIVRINIWGVMEPHVYFISLP